MQIKRATGFAKVILLVAIAIIAAGAGALFSVKSSSSSAEESLDSVQRQLVNSTVLPIDYKRVPEFTLLNKNAETVTSDSLKGQWNFLFFGFTHCPDVCPLTLRSLSDAVAQINALDANLPVPNVVFVSVDPKRDTPENVKKYVEFFNPTFNALTGTLNQMYELINPINVVVSYTVDEDNPEEYSVDHTASILLIDPQLQLRGKLNAPDKPEDIARDYQSIVKHALGTS